MDEHHGRSWEPNAGNVGRSCIHLFGIPEAIPSGSSESNPIPSPSRVGNIEGIATSIDDGCTGTCHFAISF